MLGKLAGLNVVAVPYKGVPLAVNDLLGGTLDFIFADLGNVLPHVKAGTLRGIGITAAKRSELVPAWPSLSEAFPGFEDITGWIAIAGPSGLAKDVADKLVRTVRPGMLASLFATISGSLGFRANSSLFDGAPVTLSGLY